VCTYLIYAKIVHIAQISIFNIKCSVPAELMPIVFVHCTYRRELSSVKVAIVLLDFEEAGSMLKQKLPERPQNSEDVACLRVSCIVCEEMYCLLQIAAGYSQNY
jgi:hypothetical protein